MTTRKMIGEDRRRAIVEIAEERGAIRVQELTEMFGVAETTIRRDLSNLAGHGVLKRSHGGAVVRRADQSGPGVRYESVFSSRLFEHEAEKRAIGSRAAEFVKDGSTIVIDSGTTATYLAHALGGKRDLVVVTNSIATAVELMDNPEIELVITGGVVQRATGGSTGDLAVVTLGELRVDQAFIATHSVSVDGGLTESSFNEVAVKRAMIGAASEVILIADHTKFGRDSLVRTAPLNAMDRVCTSRGVDPGTVAAMREMGAAVTVVDPLPLED
jgi:DeoR family fructose operon transcriptional repressor